MEYKTNLFSPLSEEELVEYDGGSIWIPCLIIGVVVLGLYNGYKDTKLMYKK